MLKITAVPNREKTGLTFPSSYNKLVFKDWLKKYGEFSISPIINESNRKRRFLEGAIVPAYCEWQYGISARDLGKDEQRRFLFKRDFNYEIVKTRGGSPVRTPKSSLGIASELVDKYVEWATENGAPIPNHDLYKKWRDQYRNDPRFPTFFDFLDFLEIECDAMPSSQVFEKIESGAEVEYPEEPYQEPTL